MKNKLNIFRTNLMNKFKTIIISLFVFVFFVIHILIGINISTFHNNRSPIYATIPTTQQELYPSDGTTTITFTKSGTPNYSSNLYSFYSSGNKYFYFVKTKSVKFVAEGESYCTLAGYYLNFAPYTTTPTSMGAVTTNTVVDYTSVYTNTEGVISMYAGDYNFFTLYWVYVVFVPETPLKAIYTYEDGSVETTTSIKPYTNAKSVQVKNACVYIDESSLTPKYIGYSKTFTEEGTHELTTYKQSLNNNGSISYSSSVTDFIIDRTAPTITIKNSDGTSCSCSTDTHNHPILIDFNDNIEDLSSKTPTFKIGSSTQSGTVSSIESKTFKTIGKYTISITDSSSNNVSKTINVIDDTAPIITAKANGKEISSGTITPYSVTVSVSDIYSTTLTRKHNGSSTTLSSTTETVTTDGEYIYTAKDENGNSATSFSFVIDKTSPTIKMYTSDGIQFSDGDSTSKFVYFNVSDTNGIKTTTITNGYESYDWSSLSSAAATIYYPASESPDTSTNLFSKEIDIINYIYNLEVEKITTTTYSTDLSSIVYSQDKASVSVGSTCYRYTNSSTCYDMIFSSLSSAQNYLKNNIINGNTKYYKSTNKTLFTHEGTWTITSKDIVNNTTSRTFTIDRTAPTITISGVSNGGVTNGKVTVFWEEANCTATYTKDGKNSTSFTSPKVFIETGVYVITLKDSYQNESKISFEIDATAPTGTLTGVTNDGTTNSNVSFTWKETNATATLNGEAYTPGTIISEENNYELILTDINKNSSYYYFTIDKTAPSFTVTPSNLQNGGSINSNILISWTERNCSIEVKKDGKNWTTSISTSNLTNTIELIEEGIYSFKIKDEWGNFTNPISLEIDATAPTGTLTGVTNNGITNSNVSFSWSESGCTATLNGELYEKGTPIIYSKNYELILTDINKNSSYYYFTIDKISPCISVNPSSLQPNEITNSNVSFTWDDPTASATLNGIPYTSGTIISEEGTYLLFVSDPYSNNSSFSFTIDKTPIDVKLNTTTQFVGSDNLTNGNVSISWRETVKEISLNGKAYTNNTIITEEGNYHFIITDLANNTNELYFTIDKTAPSFTLHEYNSLSEGEELFNSLINDTNQLFGSNSLNGLSLIWSESGCTATLNGNPYEKGTAIINETTYVFVLTDSAGNEIEFAFSLDYSPYTKNYEYFIKNNYTLQNHWFETFDYKFDSSSNTYKKNIIYSFENYNNAYKYALNREKSIIESGTYNGSTIWSTTYNMYIDKYDTTSAYAGLTYYIYKDIAGNIYAFFSQDSLDTAISYYVDNSISEKWLPDTPASPFDGEDLSLDAIYIKGSSFGFNYKPTDVTLYVNDRSKAVSYNTIFSTEGTYYITEIDSAGNEQNYIIILDNSLPSFVITDSNGVALPTIQNAFANQTEIRCTQQIHVKALDDFDENCVIYINNVPFIYSSNENGYLFNQTGKYTIYAIDCSNNKTRTITLYLSLEKITHYFEDVYAEDDSLAGFNFEILLNNEINKINTINVFVYNDVDGTKSLSKDVNGLTIDSSNLQYYFSESGIYTINITDIFGRSYEFTHEIQRGKPQGALYTINGTTITPLQNGVVIVNSTNNIIKNTPSVTNKAVYLSWNDSSCDAYIINSDGSKISYTSGTKISASGSYLIALENDDSQISYFSFIIDKTAPSGNFYIAESDSVLQNNSYVNKSIYFSWEEEGCTATLNGISYTKNSIISNDNSYTIILTDTAGNSASFTVYLKTTPPKVTISSSAGNYNSGGYANKNVTFSWSESGCYYYLDGVLYESGKSITVRTDGLHILQIYDRHGNFATYSITLDRTAPEGTLNTTTQFVGSDNLTNGDVKLITEDPTAIILLNGKEYIPGTLITKEGSYSFTIIDLANNTTTYSCIIDKTAPTGTLTGVTNEGITNSNVSFSWSESGCTATLNGESYTKGSTIKTEKTYTLILTDKAGNTTSYYFTIDKTPENGTLVGVENNGITNSSVSFIFDDSKATATLNGISYTSGTIINADNSYTIILTDTSGNESTYSFTIRTTIPEIILNGATNDGTTNSNVTMTWDAKDYTVTYQLNDGSVLPYTKGDVLKAEGTYYVFVVCSAGNTNEYSFTIDKTPIDVKLNTTTQFVGSDNLTNGDVSISWEEEGCTAYINNIVYTNNTIITTENTYQVIIKDSCNNETIINFKIDKTAPTGTLTGVTNEGVTNSNVSFSWSESGCTATLNGNPYEKGDLIKAEGDYIVILTDKAGNNSAYTWSIDKTAPEGFLDGVTNNGITNSIVIFTYNHLEASATLNGEEYISGTPITEDNTYTICVRDYANNKNYYYFTISKTIPEIILNGVTIDGTTNSNVTLTWDAKDYTVTYQLNDGSILPYTKGDVLKAEGTYYVLILNKAGSINEYSFTIDKTPEDGVLEGVENGKSTNTEVVFTFDDSKATATLNGENYLSGSPIVDNNSYTIILTDKAGNNSTYQFEIDTIAPEGVLHGVTNDGITNSNVSFTWDDRTAIVTLNGEVYTNNTIITEEGTHEIKIKDVLGNSRIYSFTIFKQAPNGYFNISISDLVNQDVSFTWFDETYICTLNDLPYASGTIISEEGTFTLILTNSLGSTSKWVFTIDKTPIEGTLFGVEDGQTTNQDVTFVVEDPEAKITLNGKEYISGTPITEDNTYTICVRDYANNLKFYYFTIDKTAPSWKLEGVENEGITNQKVIFFWEEEGCTATLNGELYEKGTPIIEDNSYTIVLKDHWNNKVTINFTIDTIAPEGTLNTTTQFVGSDNLTNGNVSFSWIEANCEVYLDGVSYSKGTQIRSEGVHEIKISDKLGNYNIFTFTIDKTPEDGVLEGVENGKSTNTEVVFTFDDSKATATLNGENYLSGSPIVDNNSYTIILTDKAGNNSTYQFEIDTIAPEGVLHGVTNGKKTNSNVSFSWSESGCTATLNGNPYEKGDRISKNNSYELILTDKAGNQTIITFSIKKSFDSVIENYQINDDSSETLLIDYINKTVLPIYFKFTEVEVNATIQKDASEPIEYISGTIISEIGEYKITFTDEFGNIKVINFSFVPPKDAEKPYLWSNVATITLVSVLTISGSLTLFFIAKNRLKNPYKFKKTK